MKSFFSFIWNALNDKILFVLLACAAISILLSFYEPTTDTPIEEATDPANDSDTESLAGRIEGAAIVLAVFVIVMVSALTDYSKERQFRQLHTHIESVQMCAVVRGGQQVQIRIADIVVGDICQVKYGLF